MRIQSIGILFTISLLLLGAACNDHERSVTGSYGNGVISGAVTMAAGLGSPSGVEVSVAGTGMTMVIGEDGRFVFAGVPENAVLQFRRSGDGIDQSITLPSSRGSIAVELSRTTVTLGRRRGAPSVPVLEVEGTIVSVSADTLVVASSHKTDVEMKLTSDTKIRKGSTPLTAADLKAGDRVHVKASVAGEVKTALEVILRNEENEGDGDEDAHTATANGIVASVGASEMVVHRANGDDVTVQVDAATLIRKYGQPVTFAEIKAGDHVECRGTRVDDHTIKAVQIEVENAPGTGRETAVVSGSVTAVDASSLTVGGTTVRVSATTKIRKKGMVITLADIHVGERVTAKGTRVDAHTITATEIQVSSSGHD
jgi:hypothetical protein